MHTLGFVVMEGFQSMALAALPVFETANKVNKAPFYDTSVLSLHGGPVTSSGGLAVMSSPFDDRHFDTIIVSGGESIIDGSPPGVLNFIRASATVSRRVASICSGAFVLAQAGLLENRRATTHWAYARGLQARFPQIDVDEDRIYTMDGNIWTSAGMTAGIDLGLAMVERDLGAEIVHRVAQALVVYHRRAGGQSQHSTLLELESKSDRIQTVLTYVRQNLAARLNVEELAEVAHLSPRQFSRAFKAETGQSPAQAVENLRLEAARFLMEQGRHTIEQIADQTGFIDRRRMREAFLRNFGLPPQTIRRNAR
ncbi:GlxA family transcriptional regulator [Enterobacter sp. Ap-1006]|uniref:GlxA family transcriptional regulator n=1 Tax=Enterobacter sp. Ap-1006 TaxID=2608345 RepID=UPI0014245100|nr:GlxA family transcriptional regulator [Enterobacter sp. Ap-1006]NIF47397.1 GlxA family transcriptional regulator [Enterobacter sp. Ap-1006]